MMERSLDITIRMNNGEFAIEVLEPESGESSLICASGCSETFPFSPDEHPEFDKAIGDEIYSWLSLWADEMEDSDSSTQPCEDAEEPPRSEAQPQKFAVTFPMIFMPWEKLNGVVNELAKDYFSLAMTSFLTTGGSTKELSEGEWGIALCFPERTDRLYKRFQDLCFEYDEAGFLDPETEWPADNECSKRTIVLPNDVSLRMIGDYITTLKGVERSLYDDKGVYFMQTDNYSLLSLWADEAAEDADNSAQPCEETEKPPRAEAQAQKFAVTFPTIFMSWEKLNAIVNEFAKDYFSLAITASLTTGGSSKELSEGEWGIALCFPERTEKLFKRFQDLCTEYDEAGFLDPETEWPADNGCSKRTIVLPNDVSLRMIGDYIAKLKGVERSLYNDKGVYFMQTDNSTDLYLQSI